MRFQIRYDYFAKLVPFVSAEPGRPAGVWLDQDTNGGVFAVATDGMVLGAFHDADGHVETPEGRNSRVMLDPSIVQRARCWGTAATLRREAERLTLRCEGAGSVGLWLGEEMVSDLGAGLASRAHVPAWRNVICADATPGVPEQASSVNLHLLSRFALGQPKGRQANVTLLHPPKATGIGVLVLHEDDFYGIIMPVRRHSTAQDSPPAAFQGV